MNIIRHAVQIREENSEMKNAGKDRKKKIMIILVSIVLCAALVLGGLMVYGKAQIFCICTMT